MQIGVVGDDDKSRIIGSRKSADWVGEVRVEVKGGGSVKRDYLTPVAGF